MRYHAYDEAPDYLRAEVGAQRRYERQKSNHPDCRDPEHPGCQSCEPEMFPEPVPEGYMTRAEFVALRRKQLDQFEQQPDDDQLRCEAGWAEIEHDFLSTWGMK